MPTHPITRLRPSERAPGPSNEPSRPSVDQQARDAIEDLGLPLPTNDETHRHAVGLVCIELMP